MASHQISIEKDSDGNVTGIELLVRDDDGSERSVVFEPTDSGDINIKGVGPNGSKSGTMDPSGNGSKQLGK
jgi:hypothetical protein